MFSSLFGRKKGADTPPDESDPIPSHNAAPPGGDEFIFVERKDRDPTLPANMYPTLGQGGYLPPNAMKHREQPPVSYLHGVPFKLAPEIASHESYETLQMELDSILALLTRQAHFIRDYDFSIERSLLE